MLDEYQQMMREAMKRGDDDDDDILDLGFLRVWLDLWGKISSKKEKVEWRDVSLEHFPFFPMLFSCWVVGGVVSLCDTGVCLSV